MPLVRSQARPHQSLTRAVRMPDPFNTSLTAMCSWSLWATVRLPGPKTSEGMFNWLLYIQASQEAVMAETEGSWLQRRQACSSVCTSGWSGAITEASCR